MLPDATALRSAAGALTHSATVLTGDTDARHRDWDRLPASGFTGEAAVEAVARLHELTTPLSLPPRQMELVARVLAVTATLREELDATADRALAVAEQVSGASPTVDALLRDLAALGELLDWACARRIDALCTPVPAEPPRRLSDLPDLPVDAVHELMLLDAPPHVVELARQHPDLRLLEASDGRLVAAVGDLESADSVATFVAGTGSSDPSGWTTHIDRTRALTSATGGAGVVWLGYTAPEQVPHALARQPAHRAGAELRRFQAELAQRFPDQQRIVVGYSYGSVVAGAAADAGESGLHADELVLVGSPGVGATHAGQLHLLGDSPGVHAVTNGADPIGLVATPRTGVHGVDPTSERFGAQVWEADPRGDHASYWDDPDFLDRIGDLTGRPGR
ncbi:alpha/beta hydrolase [Corynebacterium halotolerans]|uniref:DUF1023 domain-containing protein n=1 Tax=Corynebacterium halotolerans YIM 70093 = DSM 44683 TaxID=1121362 RepID=M1NQ92_9CORY|nr:alpha/beta hydrolase [Corynebacterium halotolerans]AGF73538.1 hypothetical protein A605_12710 [Corynebacterium halotolerans YIM 70093 = DSM 44683]